MPETPHLDRVKSPEDLRNLSVKELKKVAEELRAETADAVSKTGGHLGAGLTAGDIVDTAFGALGSNSATLPQRA